MDGVRGRAGQPSDKTTVRRSALSARRLLSPADLDRCAAAVAEALADLVRGARCVASYVPLPFEPRPPVVDGALLPVLRDDRDLDWERDGVLLGREAVADADLLLVPAVAVDHRGVRLGRGGGSYDRALRRATGQVVALVHDDELVPELPREPHDVTVGWVVTPTAGLVRLPA